MSLEKVLQERSFEEQLASLELGAILAGEDGSFRFYHDKLTGEFVTAGHWSIIGDVDDPLEALGPRYIYGRGKTIEEASEAIFQLYRNCNFLLHSRIRLLCSHTAVSSALFSLWAKDNQDKETVKERISFYYDDKIALWGYDEVFEELGGSKNKPICEEAVPSKPIEETSAKNLAPTPLTPYLPVAHPDVNLPPIPPSKGIITKEIAEQFTADQYSVQLYEFAKIDDAAAESLSKHNGDLGLSGLTELSDAAAESLSKFNGRLYLSGLKELSDAAAQSLSKINGGLSLCGLTEISDAAAESLSKCNGSLDLSGLTELSDAAAESLSKCNGSLGLSGLKELSDAAAESLAKIYRCRLGLLGEIARIVEGYR